MFIQLPRHALFTRCAVMVCVMAAPLTAQTASEPSSEDAKAQTAVETEAGVSYKGGLLERFGGHLESLGKRLTPIADKAEEKVRYCVLKVNTQNILGAVDSHHGQFLQSDQEILDILLSIPVGPGSSGDLNDDGTIDLADYSLFLQTFGSTGKP